MAAISSGLLELLAKNLFIASLQAGALAALIWLFERVYRKAPPLLVYWLWMIVVLRLLLPVDIPVPERIHRSFSKRAETMLSGIRNLPVYSQAVFTSGSGGSGDARPVLNGEDSGSGTRRVKREFPVPDRRKLSVLWFALAVFFGLVIAARMAIVRRRLKLCTPVVNDKLTDLVRTLRVRLFLTRDVALFSVPDNILDVPAVAGIFAPRILIPESMIMTWRHEELTPIILHELAHVQRNDLIINWLQIAVQAVHFFNPAVWYANIRIRDAREELCDDIAVSTRGSGRREYSASILKVMERITGRPALCGLCIALTERKSRVVRRIERIMHSDYHVVAKLPVFSTALVYAFFVFGALLSFASSSVDWAVNPPMAPKITRQIPENMFIPHKYPVDSEGMRNLRMMLISEDMPLSDMEILAISGENGQADGLSAAAEALALGINKYTNLNVTAGIVSEFPVKNADTFPLILIDSSALVKFSSSAQTALRRYIEKGGFVYIDDTGGDQNDVSVFQTVSHFLKENMRDDAEVKAVEADHPLFFSFFDFMDGAPDGSRLINREIKQNGLWFDDRLSAIASSRGMFDAWTASGGRGPQLKYGVNIFVHALFQQDGLLYRRTVKHRRTDDTGRRPNQLKAARIIFGTDRPIRSNSVQVNLNGRKLYVNVDYVVDYLKKEVLIFAPEALKPAADLSIYYEELPDNKKTLDLKLYEKESSEFDIIRKNRLIIPMTARVGFEDGTRMYMF